MVAAGAGVESSVMGEAAGAFVFLALLDVGVGVVTVFLAGLDVGVGVSVGSAGAGA